MNRLPLAIIAALGSMSMPAFDVSLVGVEQFVSRDAVARHARMGGGMHPTQLHRLGRQRRRAAQGKPGKRGKRGRA